MFFKKKHDTQKELGDQIKTLRDQIKTLKKERNGRQDEIERLKLKKKIEDEDIKHMVKMKEEKLGLEFKKKEMDIEQEKQDAIAKVKDAYRDKTEKSLVGQKDDIKEMYGQILQRLPDVNVNLKGGVR